MAVTAQLAGIKLTHVAYRGAQAAYQECMASASICSSTFLRPRAHKSTPAAVRALAVSSGTTGDAADVPSVMETGVAPLDMEAGLACSLPLATPAPVLARLRTEFTKVVADPEVAALFAKDRRPVAHCRLPETEALIRRDVERWTKLIREAGISGGQ